MIRKVTKAEGTFNSENGIIKQIYWLRSTCKQNGTEEGLRKSQNWHQNTENDSQEILILLL